MAVQYEKEFVQLCRHRNRCTIDIQSYRGDANVISALLTVWLLEHDPHREDDQLAEPEIEIEQLDSGYQAKSAVDVLISLDVIDSVYVKASEAGNLAWQGQTWQLLDQPEYTTATSVGGVEHG